jgi:PqqD family protein of HPr-rel-A system
MESFSLEINLSLVLTHAGRELIWQDWNDVYIVYQPSSTETHVFNETTAAVLQALEKSPLTITEVANRTAQALDLGFEDISDSDLSFAVARLEELGLIECSNATVQ